MLPGDRRAVFAFRRVNTTKKTKQIYFLDLFQYYDSISVSRRAFKQQVFRYSYSTLRRTRSSYVFHANPNIRVTFFSKIIFDSQSYRNQIQAT